MSKLESKQLATGSIIYLPEYADNGLVGLAYEITSITDEGEDVIRNHNV